MFAYYEIQFQVTCRCSRTCSPSSAQRSDRTSRDPNLKKHETENSDDVCQSLRYPQSSLYSIEISRLLCSGTRNLAWRASPAIVIWSMSPLLGIVLQAPAKGLDVLAFRRVPLYRRLAGVDDV